MGDSGMGVCPQPMVSLRINQIDGPKFIRCGLHITISELKELFLDKEGPPIGNMILVMNGRTLEDSKTLSDYRTQDNNKIEVVMRFRGGARPEVNLIIDWVSTGENFEVQCNLCDAVGHLKDMIQVKTGIPPNNQKLKHHDETLSDHKTLPDYGIGNNSTVQLYENNYDGEWR